MTQATALYYHGLAKRHGEELASLNAKVDQIMRLDPRDYCAAEAILLSGIQETLRPNHREAQS